MWLQGGTTLPYRPRMMRRLGGCVVVAWLAIGCGKEGPTEREKAACRAVCEHMHELTMADIDRSTKLAGDPDLGARLMAKAGAARESDLATCSGQCLAGKIHGRCAMEARTLDAAMACLRP